jgi:hypothetical protein
VGGPVSPFGKAADSDWLAEAAQQLCLTDEPLSLLPLLESLAPNACVDDRASQ